MAQETTRDQKIALLRNRFESYRIIETDRDRQQAASQDRDHRDQEDRNHTQQHRQRLKR